MIGHVQSWNDGEKDHADNNLAENDDDVTENESVVNETCCCYEETLILQPHVNHKRSSVNRENDSGDVFLKSKTGPPCSLHAEKNS